jgi:aminoglycoside phosphotransferase (APT) family kinase protein
VKKALEEALGTPIADARQLAGGASKEGWSVETTDGRTLFVRRAMGGVIHHHTLSLREEFDVIVAAREAGVTVPEPIAYLGDLDGREAFVVQLVEGEAIGRRVVREPPPGLGVRMAEELARIHAIPRDSVRFLPETNAVETMCAELDGIGEPHPAIEYGLAWFRERELTPRPPVVTHGDFRIGNLMVDDGGLAAVLDWEFAHVGDPLDDLAWPVVRAWRFGADERRLGGVDDVEPYLARYAELTGTEVSPAELDAWEVLGNCKWAVGCLNQGRRHLSGEDRSVEFAVLGRLAAEQELELLDLIAHAEGHEPGEHRPPRPVTHDRPSACELATAVREFLESEILPHLDDHRTRFRTLVAMNALTIVERESPPPVERDPSLAHAIRTQGTAAGDLDELRADVEARLAIASPRALERYRA